MKQDETIAPTAARLSHRPKPKGTRRRQRRKKAWKILGLVVLVLALLLGVARALMPWVVRDYVNRTLDANPLYAGEIGPVQIHLWRGAYSIQSVRISKRIGNVPVPFFAAERIDFAVQWKSLWHGRVVGRMVMDQPEINLVDGASEDDTQTGAHGPWLEMIADLFPFHINSALVRDGSVHFRTYQAQKPVDVYLSHLEGSIDNLTNIHGDTDPLVASAQFVCLAMDQAKLECKMTLDPFSYRPTFHLGLRLLGLDVTKINDLALTYGKLDFKRGWLDLVIETDAKEGQLTGYVKPLFRDLQVFSLDDVNANVIQVFWQALVGAATNVFKNQLRDQFGTLIPFSGDLSGTTSTDLLATIGNVLRNAFVRAYLPHLEPGYGGTINFEPPVFTDLISADGL
jgi:hypothetical protein